MITNLNRFSPADWQENGLLIVSPIQKAQQVKPRDVKPLVTSFTISLMWVSITFASTAIPKYHSDTVPIIRQIDLVSKETAKKSKISGDEISSSAWPKLMALIDALPKVQAPDGLDPDPII